MKIGEVISLKEQSLEIVECKNCKHLMVNIDADHLKSGDLTLLKKEKVRVSNPETDKPICVNCEVLTFGRKVADWFEKEEDDDDTPFFSSPSSGGLFGGGSSLGGFGGFGGGGFGGGGASRGF